MIKRKFQKLNSELCQLKKKCKKYNESLLDLKVKTSKNFLQTWGKIEKNLIQ